MANGVSTNNIESKVALSDEVLVNREGSTALQPTKDLAVQIAGSEVFSGQNATFNAALNEHDQKIIDQETRLNNVETQQTTNMIVATAWSGDLENTVPAYVGQGAEIPDDATGSHIDPQTASTVSDAGRYKAFGLTAGAWTWISKTGLSDKTEKSALDASSTVDRSQWLWTIRAARKVLAGFTDDKVIHIGPFKVGLPDVKRSRIPFSVVLGGKMAAHVRDDGHLFTGHHDITDFMNNDFQGQIDSVTALLYSSVKMVFVGDSTVYGSGSSNAGVQNPAAKMKAAYPDTDARHIALGGDDADNQARLFGAIPIGITNAIIPANGVMVLTGLDNYFMTPPDNSATSCEAWIGPRIHGTISQSGNIYTFTADTAPGADITMTAANRNVIVDRTEYHGRTVFVALGINDGTEELLDGRTIANLKRIEESLAPFSPTIVFETIWTSRAATQERIDAVLFFNSEIKRIWPRLLDRALAFLNLIAQHQNGDVSPDQPHAHGINYIEKERTVAGRNENEIESTERKKEKGSNETHEQVLCQFALATQACLSKAVHRVLVHKCLLERKPLDCGLHIGTGIGTANVAPPAFLTIGLIAQTGHFTRPHLFALYGHLLDAVLAFDALEYLGAERKDDRSSRNGRKNCDEKVGIDDLVSEAHAQIFPNSRTGSCDS